MVYKKHSLSSAFTIVELLVVIVVIGILAAITIVSYTGISNRATISSLQSDLTNASTTLKLDYVSNGTFPATLASANGGKGITQSQTLDNIIYIPDNTSNSNNFCLQYRKGNNTYAVDNNSAVSSGVCLQNLVGNGDFRDGTSGWSPAIDNTISSINNILTITGNGVSSAPRASTTIMPYAEGKKIYIRFNGKVTNSLCSSINVRLASSGMGTVVGIIKANPISGVVYNSGIIITSGVGGSGSLSLQVTSSYPDAATANGKIMETTQVLAIDLTASFGAGNEPTVAQADAIMANYPNSWFNITAKANL